ncbi:TonB-dependent receptor domain-containing protein [Methylophaga sp. OBS1]|uniref:TonB-dependent receptor domain-containing protein n=1 Tax=Methylophaga sp. OBS1 TaxID=2991933 RepID=UPI002253D909|nr:TonB-dependent receptor [Methylophaga sp. OBS1]MCX4193967.1 TonB-dependent receptor [Methylophaga sp. OBS1]
MSKNLKSISRPTVLSVALMSAIATQSALAETVQLDKVRVTGNTITPELNSVTSEQIEKVQANDLEDLFSQSPEISVGGGADIAQKLYVRGIEDQLLNISIDGAVQATRLFHHAGRISIEPELLKRVEVNAGSGNALSGAGALGGSVKFVTKDPEDMLKPGEQFGGLVKGMFSSNTDSFKTNTSLFGRLNDDWSAMVSATNYNADAYEDGDGDEVVGSKFDQDFLFAKVVGHLTDSQTVRLSYQKRTDEGERPFRPQWGVYLPRNPIVPTDLQRETVTFNYALNPIGNPYLDMDLTVYHIDSELDRSGDFRPYFGSGESKGVDLRNTSILGQHKVTYGVDYREDETQAGPPTDRSNLEEDVKVKGVYLQDDIQITDALLLSAGLRYDDYELDDADNQNFDEDEISHNVGINYHFTDNWSAFASYAESFKGPTSQDAYKLFGTNSPDLKPEDADNTELGVAYESSTWFGSAKVYRSNIDDLIADPIGDGDLDGTVFTNVGDLESDGYILEIGRRWERLMGRLSYHHNDIEIDGRDAGGYSTNGVGNTIGDSLVATLDYQLNSQWTLGWNAQFVKGEDNVDIYAPGWVPDGASIDKPGYGVHDFYAQWRPSTTEDVTITLTVRNVFDKYYLDHATVGDLTAFPGYEISGFAEPGRDVRLGVAWQF